MRNKRTRRAQNALEYLLAYGWTLILVGIIIFALFELGVFTGSTFAARAQPDSCIVVKTVNNGTTLQGDCSGQLPQSVASFNPLLGSSYVEGPTGAAFPTGNGAFSIFAWINTINDNPETIFSFGGTGSGAGIALRVSGSAGGGSLSVSDYYKSVGSVVAGLNDGNWHFVGVVHPANSSTFDMFIDGQWSNSSVSGTVDLYNGSAFFIGKDPPSSSKQYPYAGQVANLQLYNMQLLPARVEQLWLTGIGGPPITTDGLAGWWPLNGNGNDYSGNGESGVPYNVTFVNSWASTYSPPAYPQ